MKNQQNKDEHYKTSDLALATTLSLYQPISSVDKTNPKRVIFAFSNSPKITDICGQFWDGTLRIDPKQFFSQLKNIKSRIYD